MAALLWFSAKAYRGAIRAHIVVAHALLRCTFAPLKQRQQQWTGSAGNVDVPTAHCTTHALRIARAALRYAHCAAQQRGGNQTPSPHTPRRFLRKRARLRHRRTAFARWRHRQRVKQAKLYLLWQRDKRLCSNRRAAIVDKPHSISALATGCASAHAASFASHGACWTWGGLSTGSFLPRCAYPLPPPTRAHRFPRLIAHCCHASNKLFCICLTHACRGLRSRCLLHTHRCPHRWHGWTWIYVRKRTHSPCALRTRGKRRRNAAAASPAALLPLPLPHLAPHASAATPRAYILRTGRVGQHSCHRVTLAASLYSPPLGGSRARCTRTHTHTAHAGARSLTDAPLDAAHLTLACAQARWACLAPGSDRRTAHLPARADDNASSLRTLLCCTHAAHHLTRTLRRALRMLYRKPFHHANYARIRASARIFFFYGLPPLLHARIFWDQHLLRLVAACAAPLCVAHVWYTCRCTRTFNIIRTCAAARAEPCLIHRHTGADNVITRAALRTAQTAHGAAHSLRSRNYREKRTRTALSAHLLPASCCVRAYRALTAHLRLLLTSPPPRHVIRTHNAHAHRA